MTNIMIKKVDNMPKNKSQTIWVLAGLFAVLLFFLSYNIAIQFKAFPDNYKVEIYKTRAKKINSTYYQVNLQAQEPEAFYSYLNIKITQLQPFTLCAYDILSNKTLACKDVDMPMNQDEVKKKVRLEIPFNQTYNLYLISNKEGAISELSQVEYIYYIETNETIPNQPPIPVEESNHTTENFILSLLLAGVGAGLIIYIYKK